MTPPLRTTTKHVAAALQLPNDTPGETLIALVPSTFEHPDAEELEQITESFATRDDDDSYLVCKEFLREQEAIDWTFDYGLEGALPLRPLTHEAIDKCATGCCRCAPSP